MASYRDEAVVLRTHKLAEADRIIVLYCRSRGKVRAVAKGVRRTKSKFGSRLSPGSIVAIQLYEGRNLDVVTQVERVDSPQNLYVEVDHLNLIMMMLEMVDLVTPDAQSNPALYKLLTGALRELDRSANPLVVPSFAARLLVLEGVQPITSSCIRCDRSDELVAFSVQDGGAVCVNCPGGEPVLPETLAAMSALFGGRVREILDDTSPTVSHQLEVFVNALVERVIERKLRSANVVKQFESI